MFESRHVLPNVIIAVGFLEIHPASQNLLCEFCCSTGFCCDIEEIAHSQRYNCYVQNFLSIVNVDFIQRTQVSVFKVRKSIVIWKSEILQLYSSSQLLLQDLKTSENYGIVRNGTIHLLFINVFQLRTNKRISELLIEHIHFILGLMSNRLLALTDLATTDKILPIISLKYTLDNHGKRNITGADWCRILKLWVIGPVFISVS